jgi:hypothetical protein
MRLELNLARDDVHPPGRWRAWAWAAAVLVVLAGSAAHGLVYRAVARAGGPAEDRLRGLEAEAKRLGTAHAAGLPAGTREALARLPGRVVAYNTIIAAAFFSWTGLLLELEAAIPPNVGLTAIQPDAGSGTVTLQGAARGLDDVTLFVQMLEQRAGIREVQLLRHGDQTSAAAGGQTLTEFTIRLHYGADAAEGGEDPA